MSSAPLPPYTDEDRKRILDAAGYEDSPTADALVIRPLMSLAWRYMQAVRDDRHSPDFETLEGRDRELRSALEEVRRHSRRTLHRRQALKEATERAALEAASDDHDTVNRWLASSLVAGSVDDQAFEVEVFNRVLDRLIDQTEPLTWERSSKDNHSSNLGRTRPVKRFRRSFLRDLYLEWCEHQCCEPGEASIGKDALEFVCAASEPVLEAAGQPLSDRRIRNVLVEIRGEF